MFRLQERNLPPDHTFPANLKELGFFVNAAGQFRMIDYPEKNFVFHYSNNDRFNEVRREAYQMCQRHEVAKRLSALGLQNLYLPQLTYTQPKPEEEASVPILAPAAEILRTRKRVVVLVNDSSQDLGILAYRRLQRELGVNGGSVINFVKEIIKRSTEPKVDFDIFKDGVGIEDKDKETPGLIVLNSGQLLYSYKFKTAMSTRSWVCMPRKTAAHDAIEVTPANHIKENDDPKQHIQFVFENVFQNPDFVARDAEIYVIAIENGGETLLDILDEDFRKYGSRITAMALVNPMVSSDYISDPKLKAYLHERARIWKVSSSSDNPRECVEAPLGYSGEVEIKDSSSKDHSASTETAKPTSWLDTLPPAIVVSTVDGKRRALTPTPESSKAPSSETSKDQDRNLEPLCPSFPDDENPFSAGECVFTSKVVQHAILEFFEDVSKNPKGFRNPVFSVNTPIDENAESMPTGWKDEEGEPIELDVPIKGGEIFEAPDVKYDPLVVPDVTDLSPERAELDMKREELAIMKDAIRDTPADDPELQKGRASLEKRVVLMEEEVEALAKKVLAMGGMKAGEEPELREKWTRVGGGPKIMFAGSMVDSELVKGAGLEDTAEAELAALELEAEKEG